MLKIGTKPPNGYLDPYGAPIDGSPCKRPPAGFGTDSWSLVVGQLPRRIKEHKVNGVLVETVEVNEQNNPILNDKKEAPL